MERIYFFNHFRTFYHQSFQPLAEKFSLQMLDIDLLLFLYNNPAYNTARDAVALRGLSKSNVSTSLEKLRRRGLVIIRPDADSRRLLRIFLMPEGNSIASELRACQEACLAQITAGFTPEECEQLQQFLDRMHTNIALK